MTIFPFGPCELHLVEARLVDAQHRHQVAVVRRHELERVAAVDDRRGRRSSAPSARRECAPSCPASAAMSPVLSTSSGASCVYAGIAILQIQPLHVRQIRDVDRVHRRAHAVRLDGVLRLARRCRTAGTRNVPVLSGVIGRRVQFAESALRTSSSTLIRLEAAQPRFDQLVAALRDRDVARIDRDAEQAHRLRACSTAPRSDCSAVPQHLRAEHREQQRAPPSRRRARRRSSSARRRRSRVHRRPCARARARCASVGR